MRLPLYQIPYRFYSMLLLSPFTSGINKKPPKLMTVCEWANDKLAKIYYHATLISQRGREQQDLKLHLLIIKLYVSEAIFIEA